MTWRLIVAVAFLERRSLFFAIVMAGLISRPTSPWWLTAAMLLVLGGAGAGAFVGLGKRELVVLPTSPAEQSRAGWILAGAFPVVLLMVARVLGGVWHAVVGDNGFVFNASPAQILFEIAYFSVIAATTAGKPERFEPPFDEDPTLWRGLAGMLAMAVLPFIVVPVLTDRVSELPLIAWLAWATAVAYGVSPLFRTPTSYKRDFPPVTTEHVTPVPLPRSQAMQASSEATGLTGLWVPLRGVAGQALAWTVVMVAFEGVLAYTNAKFSLWGPFDSSLTDLRFLFSFGLFPMFLLGLSPSLAPWIAALKRLPISSHNTALLLSLSPAMMPVVYWAALLVIHLVSAWQWPDTMRLGLLSLLIGIASLADAVGTRGGSTMVTYAAGGAVFMAIAYAGDNNRPLLESLLAHWAVPLVGLTCFSLSWALNLHMLRRSPGSSRVFRFNTSWQSARAR